MFLKSIDDSFLHECRSILELDCVNRVTHNLHKGAYKNLMGISIIVLKL